MSGVLVASGGAVLRGSSGIEREGAMFPRLGTVWKPVMLQMWILLG